MKSVEEKNEEFILSILHDIKSPIVSINIALENLKTRDEILNEIYKTNKHNLEYIENLLENYSFKTGKYLLKQEYFNVVNMINEEVFALRALIIEKNLKLNLVSTNPNIFLSCDRQMVRRAFLNLLTNAIKYSPDNEEIKIEVSKLKKTVSICVTNTCKSFLGKDKNNTILGSTGLGAAIIEESVARLKGKIYHTKNRSKICFYVELPIT